MAQRTVFAAAFVRDCFQELIALDPARTVIRPQGVYQPPEPDPERRARSRAALNTPLEVILAIGIGYADLRKGFDLFLQVWRAARERELAVHFVWVGGIDPTIETYLGSEIAAAEATGTFRCLGHRTDAMDLLAAADVFLGIMEHPPPRRRCIRGRPRIRSGSRLAPNDGRVRRCSGRVEPVRRFLAVQSVTTSECAARLATHRGKVHPSLRAHGCARFPQLRLCRLPMGPT